MKSILNRLRQSLSLKLSVGIVLLAVPIFVIALGILFQQSRANIRQEAVRRATSTLHKTTLRVARYMNTVKDATNTTAWLVTEHFQPDSLLALSRRIVMLNGHVGGCSITAEPDAFPQYGRYFSAYSVRKGDSIVTEREAEYDYFSAVWYRTPLLKNEACWVDPFDDRREGTLSADGMIASYCRPLRSDDGRLLGVIATDLSLASLAKLVAAEEPYPRAYFLMLGADGHYFVHPDSTRLVDQTIFTRASAADHPDIIALGHEMISGKQGDMYVDVDGNTCLVCYQPVPGTQWSLALVCPTSDIFSSYKRLTLIIVPLIVIGLVLILFFSRHIVAHSVRPLHHLVEQSMLIARGHYREKIPHSRRADAVGRLQNSFARMQQSIDRHVSDIRRMNDEALRRNEELKHARLMAIEGNRQKLVFIQNMTHQIRTPLNIILGFAQVMRDSHELLPDTEIADITQTMRHHARLLNRMVLMLYDSSDSGLSEELDSHRNDLVGCNEVARQSIRETYEHFQGMEVAFSSVLPDEFSIHTNRLYLMRSLREILYNSAKYSDKKNIALHVDKTDTHVRYVIQDTGPGIDPDSQERMFAFFAKVNDLSEGLGLGLPLAKRHAVNLGGDLTLDADYHEGCRFIFDVPL